MRADPRDQDELSTQQRASVMNVTYIDARSLNPQEFPTGLMDVAEMRTLGVIPIERGATGIVFAITINTTKSYLQDLRSRYPEYTLQYKLISNMGLLDIMNILDPPPTEKKIDVEITSEGQSANFEAITEKLNTTRPKEIFLFLIRQAYALGSSDVHIEPYKNYTRIRFRIDGMLHEIGRLLPERYQMILSEAALRGGFTANTLMPQAGRITAQFEDASGTAVQLSMRVEAVPSLHGQDVVIRLFSFDESFLDLDKIGLKESERKRVDSLIQNPHGMVLVVGPTGSGKSTTLYSILKRLNTPDRKIVTLEDPVEYEFDGVTQVPVFTDEGDSFDNKLSAVLREDPDVIMIGEIRDADTAKTALQAALTGHLVLASFHAQSAAAALSRLTSLIGHNPLLASALRMVMAQRLIRRVKDDSTELYSPDEHIVELYKRAFANFHDDHKPDFATMQLKRVKPELRGSITHKGRIMLIEQLQMSSQIEKLLSGEEIPTTKQIHEAAVQGGMMTLLQDGLLKAMRGETTLEEVLRVVDAQLL